MRISLSQDFCSPIFARVNAGLVNQWSALKKRFSIKNSAAELSHRLLVDSQKLWPSEARVPYLAMMASEEV
jgi:hypothetical protein